jgi:hypothetical protein
MDAPKVTYRSRGLGCAECGLTINEREGFWSVAIEQRPWVHAVHYGCIDAYDERESQVLAEIAREIALEAA